MIAAEGIESLDLVELAAACSARGIRTVGVSPARMRLELQQWIDLHLNHGIPSTLLLLSRAFAISDSVPVVKHVPAAEALQATLQSLPEEMKEETRMVYSEAVGAKVDPREKLELLKKQEAMIAEELKQEEDEKKRVLLTVAKEEVKDAAKVAGAKGAEAAVGKVEQAIRIADTARAATPETAAATVEKAMKEELKSAPAPSEGVVAPAQKPTTVIPAAPTPIVDTAALKQLGEALEVLVSPSAFAPEMDDLKEIKKDRAEYREDLSLVESLVAGGPAGKALETKAGTMLGKRLDNLLKRIDADLLEYDKGMLFWVGSVEATLLILFQSLSVIGDKLNLLKPNEVGLIPLEQVVLALQSIKVGPNSVTDKRIEQLIDSLDPDGDGMGGFGTDCSVVRKRKLTFL
jgi:LETM1 and EF-hand domain-containing protein 1